MTTDMEDVVQECKALGIDADPFAVQLPSGLLEWHYNLRPADDPNTYGPMIDTEVFWFLKGHQSGRGPKQA